MIGGPAPPVAAAELSVFAATAPLLMAASHNAQDEGSKAG